MTADLDAFAAKIRRLRNLAIDAAKEAAPDVEKLVRETAAAGTDVEGRPWPPKRDGSRALANAAGAVTAVARGVAVILKLSGAYVFHHRSKGKERRPILPEGGASMPPRLAAVLRAAAARAFRTAIGR
ncbi:MAG: hypothetical protein KF795_00265 [Labilithrix sp.]|nr:hypothetical protein [Labilithrix sp.]